MGSPNEIWNDFIGSSSWRTLIAFESWALRNSEKLVNICGPKEESQDVNWPEDKDKHLYIYPVNNANAAVVFLGGREFLVGAPIDICKLPNDKKPKNVILLSWEEEHIGGLIEYLNSSLNDITILTSEWIWEKIQDLAAKNEHNGLLTAVNVKPVGEIEDDKSSDNNGKSKIKYVIFEDHLNEIFAPQVELYMYYEIGSEKPRLQARFRLFGTYLTVCLDHPKKWLKMPTIEEYRENCILPIYDQFPDARRTLSEVVEKRLTEIMMENMLERESTAIPQHIFSGPKEFYRYTIKGHLLEKAPCGRAKLGDLCPVQVRKAKCFYGKEFNSPQEWNKKEVLKRDGDSMISKLPLEPASPNNLNEGDDKLQETKIYLAIACGGLSIRSGGEITPVRRILLGDNKINISLLGLKVLDFLMDRYEQDGDHYKLREKRIFEKTLILVPSPWTQEAVYEEMSRILWEYQYLWEKEPDSAPRILYLHQKVILPIYNLENKKLNYKHEPGDSAIQYSPTGHFNSLDSIFDDDVKKELSVFDDKTLIYFTNYNNLGRNINQGVLKLANHILQDQNCPVVFELIKHIENGQPKDQGSYWVKSNNASRLFKPFYYGIDGANWVDNRDEAIKKEHLDKLYMSTGSFLLYPARLDLKSANFQDKIPFYVRSREYSKTGGDNLRFERDVDQITWLNDNCQGVLIIDNKKRFFPIKEEKDLYATKYEELKKLYNCLLKKIKINRTAPSARPLHLSHVENYAVWGGKRIRHDKLLPPIEDPLSETWEASTHPKGVSGIKINALHDVPLTSIVSINKFDVMAKFLDCNDWLSIQLHPSKWVIDKIINSKNNYKELLAELALTEDDCGKEELFYILDINKKLSNRLCCFGLESEAIKGLAGCEESTINENIYKDVKNAMLKSERLKFEVLLPDLKLNEEIKPKIEKEYQCRLSCLIEKQLIPILQIREEKDAKVLDGIALILAIQALRESIEKLLQQNENVQDIINKVFINEDSPLLKFFHYLTTEPDSEIGIKPGSIIRVQPGVVHALGPGMYLTESSNQSDNTFRIFDHGREFRELSVNQLGRQMHYLLAAISLSDESFMNKETEKRYLFYGQTSDYVVGNIQLESIGSEKLREWCKLEKIKPNCGYILLCTKGKIRLRVNYSNKEIKAWQNIEIPHTYTAFIPPAEFMEAECRRVDFEDSSVIGICAKSIPQNPVLCITLGGTHFQFTYQAYPKPRQEKLYLWHNVLENFKNTNWETRKDKINEKLKEFLDQYHKEEDGQIEFLGLSWPGFIKNNEIYSAILQKKDGSADIVDTTTNNTIKKAAPSKLLFDASADIQAEILETIGTLRDNEGKLCPGMLINFASGLCMGIFDGKEIKDEIKNIPIKHLGRFMWYDPSNWKWYFDKDWNLCETIKRIKEGNYNQSPPKEFEEKSLDKRVIRASEFLSTTAVVFRFLWHIRQHKYPSLEWFEVLKKIIGNIEIDRKDLEETLKDKAKKRLECCMENAKSPINEDSRGQKFGEIIRKYRPVLNAIIKPLFEFIAEEANSKNNGSEMQEICSNFIKTIAYDYGDMIAALIQSLSLSSESYSSNIILGGYGGTHFGLYKDKDIFLNALNQELRQHDLGEVTVKRSQANQFPYRLLTVCRYLVERNK